MKRLVTLHLVVALALSLCATLAAQAAPPRATAAEVDLSVNGIQFGSTYEQIVQKIGRTRKQEREQVRDDTCGPPYMDLGLTYDGLFIRLKGTPKETAFKAVSFDVTSAKWMIQPGIRVGMADADVRKVVGEPSSTDKFEGTVVEHFVNKGDNGIANLFVKNGKLVRVAWEVKLC